MRLLSLRMSNLRSHRKAEVEFADGITLFEGDIGSGKSSVLQAVEFALFGLGDTDGSFLLRHGEDQGSVELVFATGERRVRVLRTLRRKRKRVQQGECELEVEGTAETLSPAEMKPRVLNLLGFRENPDPRARSDIFRFGVYTPQEEMRTVLDTRASMHNQRKETLRRALGIQDFRQAHDAARWLMDAVVMEATLLEGKVEELGSAPGRLEGTRAELEEARGDLEAVREELEAATRAEAAMRGELEEADRHADELRRAEGEASTAGSELDRARASLSLHQERLRGAEADLERARARLVRAGDALAAPADGADPEEALAAAEDELAALREEHAGEVRGLAAVQASLEVIEAEEAQLSELEGEARCPRCQQPLTEGHLEELLARYKRERSPLTHRAREHASRERKLAEAVKASEGELRALTASLERRRAAGAEVARAREDLERATAARDAVAAEGPTPEERASAISELEARAEEAGRLLEGLRGGLDMQRVRELRRRHAAATAETARLAERQRARERAVSEHVERIGELESDVERLGRLRELAALYGHLLDWLGDCFRTAMDRTEVRVMEMLRDEMDVAASSWFDLLVEDPDLELRVDEEFVPVVSQQGYDVDVRTLSGGERTAVAFAYRLALNCLVMRHATGDESNLLMLDEPTDGFSREQLTRMGAVLGQLEADQVVIVSHDRELESFADRVYLVRRGEGIVRVGGEGAANP